ncbi:MAG: tyrosine-type recombinase/integrase [Chloroflexota bacterium]
MNRKPSGSSMLLSKAIVGFLSFKEAEGLTSRTLDSYKKILEKWQERIGDGEVGKIDSRNVITYLNWLRNEYVPHRLNGKIHPLSPKTIRNFWICLCAFFKWAHVELSIPSPMDDVPTPKYKLAPVETFTKDEIERMLKGCQYTRDADTIERKKFAMKRPTASRDQAIILTLLDTGLRAMELCLLKIGDYDSKLGKFEIKHGVTGGAKGGKGRTVYAGKSARRVIWRYLAARVDVDDVEAPLFLGNKEHELTPNALRHLIVSIAKKADVKKAYPHKFRHTFAITYLRSGGDIFTLQSILGHGSLDMTRHYANIAGIDTEQAHRKASPVDNWRL